MQKEQYTDLDTHKVKPKSFNAIGNIFSGAQILVVAFGSLVLVPLITGLDPSIALLGAGLGTLLFHAITKMQVPIFLASSFAFIAPIIYSKEAWGLSATMGALMAAGVFYMLLSLAIKKFGTSFIDRFFPPIVVGPVIMVIGLGLAPIAINMALGKTGDGAKVLFPYGDAIVISMISLITTMGVAVFARGIFKLLPIVSGIVVGFVVSLMYGIVDFTNLQKAAWFAIPDFVTPSFNIEAILFMLPVAIAPAIEHVGDMLAISGVTGKDFIKKPGLWRTLLGDGMATTLASSFGAPPNTTYSEVTGAVILTKNFNPLIMVIGACFAVMLAFVQKLGVLLQTIPSVVMGGIMTLLFGSIAVVGLNTLVKSKQDLLESRNLVIVSVVLVFGIGGMVIGSGDMVLKGVSLCAVLAVVLNAVLPQNLSKENI